MKVLWVVILALLGLGYYIYNNHSPFQTEVTDPYYVELRLKLREQNVQLVGIGRMNSYADCEARSLMVWAKTFEHLGEVTLSSECKKTLPQKYLKLFDNQQANASYIAFDKGNDSERDARFLIYGVPSSHVYQACDVITQQAKQQYTGKVYCIQGAVG